ncbi:hypothetical protein [Hymenobacter antarcticus]|uniref:hypothetical protein n=1 Tax=Hymenobacter antarcticus TaxID=486270 RepID=UPI0031E6605A
MSWLNCGGLVSESTGFPHPALTLLAGLSQAVQPALYPRQPALNTFSTAHKQKRLQIAGVFEVT